METDKYNFKADLVLLNNAVKQAKEPDYFNLGNSLDFIDSSIDWKKSQVKKWIDELRNAPMIVELYKPNSIVYYLEQN